MALRFGPAGGRNTWSRPADSTSVGASGDEGALSGARDGRVHGYGPEIAPAAGEAPLDRRRRPVHPRGGPLRLHRRRTRPLGAGDGRVTVRVGQ